MAINYIEMRLEDCMDAIIDYRGKTPKKVDNGIPLITAKIIKNGRIQEVSEFIAIDDYDNWMVRGLPLEGDVVLTTEAPLGEVAQLDARKVALAQRVITLRGKKGTLENDYLLYLLQSSFVQNQLDGRASRSTVTGIKQSELREIILRLPPTALQKSISHQLKCLDKKIDLNNKINQTLEQMSQTLFKSWFVDFDPVIDNALDAGTPIPEALQSRAELRQKVRNSADFKPLSADIRALFPAEFEETELGWVPKGWQTKSMHDLVESVSITFPLSKTDKVIFLNTGDIETGSFLHQNYSKTEGLPGQAKKSIKKGDILFSEIRPENKRYAFVHFESDDYVVSTKLMVLRAKNEINPLLPYFIITLEDNTKKLQRIAELRSGTFPQITFKELEVISFIMPNNDKIMDLFINSYLAPAYNKIIETKKANINLINLRDTLLPKLISGELSLEDLPNLANQTEPA
ncbi:TPA: restriction endonuclease subunit S [Citrobacter werkmanii]